MKYKWRTQNDGRDQEFSDLSGFRNTEPSLTIQSNAFENDPNWIVQNYIQTGNLPTGSKPPMWGDFTNPLDYKASLDAIRAAQEDFNRLDAKLRRRFENDPLKLLEFITDPANTKEAIELGIATPRETTQPVANGQAVTADDKTVSKPVTT